MMFASKTPRDLNHDPEPWVAPDGTRRVFSHVEIGIKRFDPRPEFDHVQHNEPNPILVDFRDYAKEHGDSAALARHWTRDDQQWWDVTRSTRLISVDEPVGTPEQEDHARKVLTRLAAQEALS